MRAQRLFPTSRYAAFPMPLHRAATVKSLVNGQLDALRSLIFQPQVMGTRTSRHLHFTSLPAAAGPQPARPDTATPQRAVLLSQAAHVRLAGGACAWPCVAVRGRPFACDGGACVGVREQVYTQWERLLVATGQSTNILFPSLCVGLLLGAALGLSETTSAVLAAARGEEVCTRLPPPRVSS